MRINPLDKKLVATIGFSVLFTIWCHNQSHHKTEDFTKPYPPNNKQDYKMITNNNNNNNQENIETKDIAVDYREEYTFSADSREEEMDLRCMEEQCIFRDLPDAEFTPMESSNDTMTHRIPLSPAWSQESMEDPEELKPSMLMMNPTPPTSPQVYYLSNGTQSGHVTRISDFDLTSGTTQRLSF